MYKIKNESGFSLLELLIALGIFMFVLIPVLGVFDNNYKSYLVQDEIAETQQNVRVAKMFLERDIRIAGAGLDGLALAEDFASLLTQMNMTGSIGTDGKVFGLGFENGTGENGSDKLNIYYQELTESVCNDGGATGGLDYCDELPQLRTSVKKNKSDDEEAKGLNGAVCLIDPDQNAELIEWGDGCYCGGVSYTGAQPKMMAMVTSPDGLVSNIVVVTHVMPSSDHLQNHPIGTGQVSKLPDCESDKYDCSSVNSIENKVLNDFDAGSTITFFSMESFTGVSYFLQNNTLMRKVGKQSPQPLAENIEDFQVAVHISDTDEWINNEDVSADNRAEQIDKIDLIRISLLARTAREHDDLPAEVRPEIEDHAAGTTADHFRRRLLQVDVRPRNLGL